MFRYALLRTVLDPVLAVFGDAGLVRFEFLPRAYQYHTRARDVARSLEPDLDVETGVVEAPDDFTTLRDELAAYFTGQLETFSIPLDLRGSDFQLKVWKKLQAIPYGKLRSYAQVAKAIRSPKAVRAVGQAAGHNPLPILVPCHRVLGRDGSLVGYAGGLALKARLLRLEGHTLGGEHHLEEPQLF